MTAQPFYLPRTTPKLIVAHCPREGCRYACSACSEGRVTRMLANHLVKIHLEANREV